MKTFEVTAPDGVPASTLRYYEHLRILSVESSPDGHRDFDEDQLERPALIASAQRLDLKLPEVRRLLYLADDGACTGAKAALQPLLAEQVTAVEQPLSTLVLLRERLRAAQVHADGWPDNDDRCRSERAFTHFEATSERHS